MKGVRNKTQFAMKRYRDEITGEKKQIQLNKKNVEKEWEKQKNK